MDSLNKLVYLRRLLEIENSDGLAWQLLSNIFHKREKPEYHFSNGTPSRLMTSEEIQGATNEIRTEYISDFEFRDGLLEIYRVAKIGNKYFNDQEPWKAVKEDMQKAANCLYLSNQLAKTLAYVLKPYIPNKADAIAKIINLTTPDEWKDAKVPLAEGHKINKAKPLFTKIEDDVINLSLIHISEPTRH